MDIAQQRQEMSLVIDGLAFKPVLIQLTRMVVFTVVVERIVHAYLSYGFRDAFVFFLDEQMDTVGHQAIGAYAAMRE